MPLKFTKREKYVVYSGACLILLFFLFQFIIFPFFEKREWYKKGIATKENELQKLTVQTARYMDLKAGSSQMEKILSNRPRGFTLFSLLERSAGEAGVKDKIKYMKPSTPKSTGTYKESLVEMRLESITLNQLVDFLYRIEKPQDLIIVKRISINDNKQKEGSLDSIVQVMTYQ